jgi:hypothetical protein
MRSTNGGGTWSVQDKRLDKVNVLNGTPYLGGLLTASGRIGSEEALFDTSGVVRTGSLGTNLLAIVSPMRNDESLDQVFAQLQLNPSQKQKQIDKPKPKPIDIAKCKRKYNNCAEACNINATGCVTAAYAAFLAGAAACWKMPNPIGRGRCLLLVSATFGAAYKLCLASQQNCLEGCQIQLEDCINGD